MAIQACSAAVTVLGPTSSSQPQLCCYGRIRTFFPSCRNTNLEKLFSEEESVFSISDRRPNYGFCFRTQALRSDHLDILKGSEALHAAKTIDVQTMLGRSVIREGGFLQDVTSSERHLENVACRKDQILKTGPLVRERELNSQNDVKFDVPHGEMVHFPKNMLSGSETEKIHAIGILTFASEMLFEDRNPSSAGAFVDIISDDSSIPNDTQSAESLPSSPEAAPNDVDSSVTIGDALVNVPSAAKEQKMEIPSDSPFSTDSLPSSESTVNSLSTDSLSSTDSTINSLSDTVSNTSEATSESLSETKNKVNFSVEGAQKGFEEFFSNVKESLDSSLNSASSAAKSTYTDINSSILKSVKSLTGSFENAISGLFPMSDNTPGLTHGNAFDVMSPFQMGTPANNAIKKVVLVVEDSAGKVLATTASLVTETYRSTKALLPSEAKYFLNNLEEIASTIIQPLGSFIQQVNTLIAEIEKAVGVDPENPIIPVILVTGGTIFVGFSYWGYIYGGYAGDLTPKQAADLLRNERNTVLIDIRPQEMKESDGVPDLRRGERFKFAAVEFPKVEGSIRKLLRNANEIDDVLTAAVVRNLKIVNGDSKVLILDANGLQSKKVARALRKLGIKRSYRIKGGFQSWVADGLRVKEMIMETPLTILKEDTEAILEETRPTPGAIVAACIGFVAAINALIEWEKTLQLIGFIGLAQVIYRRINSYETAEDLKADIRALLSPFRWASQGILSNAGQTGPSKLQLATSPSTTAVQNRVLQAAAKHSSISSELEDAQDKEPILNSAMETDNLNEISQEEIRSQE